MDKSYYVCGLYFNESKTEVALIRKNRPEWQKGKLNGIGGSTESDESPLNAMIREFKEEAGVEQNSWKLFCILSGNNYSVHFFTASGDLDKLESLTDEGIEIWSVPQAISNQNIIKNLSWLIPMAANSDKLLAKVEEHSF